MCEEGGTVKSQSGVTGIRFIVNNTVQRQHTKQVCFASVSTDTQLFKNMFHLNLLALKKVTLQRRMILIMKYGDGTQNKCASKAVQLLLNSLCFKKTFCFNALALKPHSIENVTLSHRAYSELSLCSCRGRGISTVHGFTTRRSHCKTYHTLQHTSKAKCFSFSSCMSVHPVSLCVVHCFYKHQVLEAM